MTKKDQSATFINTVKLNVIVREKKGNIKNNFSHLIKGVVWQKSRHYCLA